MTPRPLDYEAADKKYQYYCNKFYWGNQIKRDEMLRACSTQGTDEKFPQILKGKPVEETIWNTKA
jgi:hypothetical protein